MSNGHFRGHLGAKFGCPETFFLDIWAEKKDIAAYPYRPHILDFADGLTCSKLHPPKRQAVLRCFLPTNDQSGLGFILGDYLRDA